MIRTARMFRLIGVVLATAGATSAAAFAPEPRPGPLSAETLERYIVCYPKIDAVRARYREELERLQQANSDELERLRHDVVRRQLANDPDVVAHWQRYQQQKANLVDSRARAVVFLPVLQSCGFASVEDYARALRAVIDHFPSQPDWLKPYADRVRPLRVPNLD